MEYRVVVVDLDKRSHVELEEEMIPLNTFFDPTSGKSKLACLIPVVLKVEESTEEKTEEEGP